MKLTWEPPFQNFQNPNGKNLDLHLNPKSGFLCVRLCMTQVKRVKRTPRDL